MTEDDRDPVAALLASTPPSDVSPGFVARVNARIDADAGAGWLGIADFRVWTLRLAPIAAAMALAAVLWPDGPSSPESAGGTSTSTAAAETFAPASADAWQQDVTPNALLEAALTGGADAR